jgi:hypothetical protein
MGWECSKYGERISLNRGLVGNLREIDHLEDPGVDERILFRWIFKKRNVGV